MNNLIHKSLISSTNSVPSQSPIIKNFRCSVGKKRFYCDPKLQHFIDEMISKGWQLVKEHEKCDLIYKVGGTKNINFDNLNYTTLINQFKGMVLTSKSGLNSILKN